MTDDLTPDEARAVAESPGRIKTAALVSEAIAANDQTVVVTSLETNETFVPPPILNDHAGWKVVRRFSQYQSREIFIGPDGTEYVRAGTLETTELTIEMKTRGLQDLRLKKRSRPFGQKED